MSITDIWSAADLAKRAAVSAAPWRRASLVKTEWDICMGCMRPVYRDRFGRPAGVGREVVIRPRVTRSPVWVELKLPCRECEACMRNRRNLWVRRATDEIKLAQRSWFVTLTLRPDEQYRALCESQLYGATDAQRRIATIKRWLTLALKRLRANTGARIRFLAVFENHKSELPHVHLIVHEYSGVVTARNIQDCWPHGFSKSKLIADDNPRRAAFYVCKYLMKSSLARVRASLRYGRPTALAIDSRRVPSNSSSSTRKTEERGSHERKTQGFLEAILKEVVFDGVPSSSLSLWGGITKADGAGLSKGAREYISTITAPVDPEHLASFWTSS